MTSGRSRVTGSGGLSGKLSRGLRAWEHDLPASNKHLQYVPVIALRNKHNVKESVSFFAVVTSIVKCKLFQPTQ